MKNLKQGFIKHLLLFVALFVLAPLANADTFTQGSTLYVKFSSNATNWPSAGAVLKVNFYGGTSGSSTVELTKLEDNSYSCKVPDGNYTTLEILRYDPNNLSTLWNKMYGISASGSNNCVTINANPNGSEQSANCTWSKLLTGNLFIAGDPFGGWGKAKGVNLKNGSGYNTYTFQNYDSDKFFSFYFDADKQISCNNGGINTDGTQMEATASTSACKIPANSGEVTITILSVDEENNKVVFKATKSGNDDSLPDLYITLNKDGSAGAWSGCPAAMTKDEANKKYTFSIPDYDGQKVWFRFTDTQDAGQATKMWGRENNVVNLGKDNNTCNLTAFTGNDAKSDKNIAYINNSNNTPRTLTFTVDFSGATKTVTVTEGTVVEPDPTPDYPEGGSYYVRGDFSHNEWTPLAMHNDHNENFRFLITLTCDNPMGWGNMEFLYTATNEDGTPFTRLFNSGITFGTQTSVTYYFDGTNEDGKYIDASALDPTKSYTFTFEPGTSNGTHTGCGSVYYTIAPDGGNYYLCGDINVWSDISTRNTSNTTALPKYKGFFSGENDYVYLQDDKDNPWLRFKSIEELEKNWKFDFVGPGPEGITGDDWYRLDLKAKGSSDISKHVGRLGGQFKIIQGNLEAQNGFWGINRNNNNNTYWQNVIKTNELFTAEKDGGQNLLLDNTVIENAVIWFNPTTNNIFIEGTPHDLYVYYVNDNFLTKDENGKYIHKTGPKVYLDNSKQFNNYPQNEPFVEKEGVAVKTDGYDFSWELYDGEGGTDYYPYGEAAGTVINYPAVWRKKIPSSIIHRTPMPFLVSVKPESAADGVWFPRVRINCDDVWFFENDINVFFRFDDQTINDADATKVFFDAWVDQYDATGNIMEMPKFFNGTMVEMKSIKPGESITLEGAGEATAYNDLIKDETKRGYKWYVAPKSLPSEVGNAGHAMFATNYGGFYPYGQYHASAADREAVALNGVDLYYVVGGSSSRVSMVYSHMKGSVALTDEIEAIQINAEFFAKDHPTYKNNDLNTFLGAEVDYRFSVRDSKGNELLPGTEAEEWRDEPFYTWEKPLDHGADLYQVTVTARKLVNGKYEYYSNTDIYPIYAEHEN